jgi:hypothetical protein
MRNIGAFIRLGWRDRAQELASWFLSYRRPPGWREWPEVVWKDERTPHFLGDLPHTWVGSDFARSVLDMFAYSTVGEQTLVLAAGVPDDWVRTDPGIEVRDLPTPYGELSYTLRERGGRLVARVDGLARNESWGGPEHGSPEGSYPSGGVILRPPLRATPREVRVNGGPAELTPDGGILLRRLPADVVVRY